MSDERTDAIERLNAALEGRYTIERKLGEGGMAMVYLANDLRHERNVALKVLKPELAAVVGGDRFLAEIKTTANLQHPHILPLHDSGEADGFLFYVMPYIEGESLRGRLDRERQLPVDGAVRIVAAVASALDFAHRQGVIHRDIKPANILLHDGEPIVADFGIALAVGALGGHRLTETGLSLGTPHYMSPEQATGDQTVGPATDIYALGCVLYEMLVGEPPFTGSTPQVILGKIISGDPDSVRSQRKAIPENVDAAVRRALETLPADRFTSAAAFSEALRDASFRYGEKAAPGTRASVWNPVSIGLAVAVVALAGVLGAELLSHSPPAPTVSTYALSLGGNAASPPGYGQGVALSPDGSRLAYGGPSDQSRRAIWVKDPDQLHSRHVRGIKTGHQPFFSPDGDRLAVTGFGTGSSASGLGVIELATGAVSTVADSAVWWGGGDWSEDGWLYVEADDGTIVRFSEISGEREAVTRRGDEEVEHVFPEVLPGGRGILFIVWYDAPDFERADVAVFDFKTGQHHVLAPGGLARYSETGHLVVVGSDGVVRAAPFDEETLRVTGPFARIFDGVAVGFSAGFDFALSAAGDLVYTAAAQARYRRELVWVDRDGNASPLDTDWLEHFESVAISPQTDRVAVTIGSSSPTGIWMKPLNQGPVTRFTFTDGVNRRPEWTPDGESLAFISDRAGNRDLYVKRADGSGSATAILDLPETVDQASWSPDGRWIVYRLGMSGEERDIFARRLGTDPLTITVSALPGIDEYSPTLSPDGRFLAYVSEETGAPEIWVKSFPDVDGGRWQVSTGGGIEPVWAKGGDELFYRTAGHLVGVGVMTDPTFSIVAVDTLFSAQEYFRHGLHPAYDITPDGQRFLMIRNPPTVSEFVVVENFGRELLEKAGR